MAKRYIGVGTFKTTPKIRINVNKVLDTARISYGPFCRKWEKDLARLHSCQFGIVSNSGTSSLLVALQTLKELNNWQDGDEVLVPAATFVATVNVVLQNGMKPVLVDVEDGYYAINPDKIADKITDRTKCIIPVHPFGQPANMTDIIKLAQAYKLKVIEDSCECMFSFHNGQSVGSFGDISCFSMYVCHIVASGIGGVSITNNEQYAIKMRSLVNHGRDSIYMSIDDSNNISAERLHEVIGKRFNFVSIGHSFRITELEAAICCAQLEDYVNNIAQRNYNAGFLKRSLSQYSDRITTLERRPSTTQSWMMFPIITYRNEKKQLCEFLEDRGIETRDALPILNQPVYNGMFEPKKYPVAMKLLNNGFYIGCYNGLTQDDLYYIVETLDDYFGRNR